MVSLVWVDEVLDKGLPVWFTLLGLVKMIWFGLSWVSLCGMSPPPSLSLWWGSCDKIARLPIYLPRAPISTLPPDTLLSPPWYINVSLLSLDTLHYNCPWYIWFCFLKIIFLLAAPPQIVGFFFATFSALFLSRQLSQPYLTHYLEKAISRVLLASNAD